MRLSLWVVVLLMCVDAFGEEGSPATGRAAPSCRVEVEIVTTSPIPREIIEAVTPELRTELEKGSTTKKTIVCEYRSVDSATSSALTYDVAILSSQFEGYMEKESIGRWEEYQDMIARGEAHTTVKVDSRGRVRIVPGDATAEDYTRQQLESFSDALFPPLQEVGKPFEEEAEWSVSSRGYWVATRGVVRCSSVKVWTPGDTEIVLESSIELPEATDECRWVLRGSPPYVTEYSNLQTMKTHFGVRRTRRHAKVLSGGLPVRPVDRAPAVEESERGE